MIDHRWTQQYEDEVVRWAKTIGRCDTPEQEVGIRQWLKISIGMVRMTGRLGDFSG